MICKNHFIKKVFFKKKAKGHQYNLELVNFALELYKYGGMSLRRCIFPCVNWVKKMLQIWGNLPSTVQEQVVFLKEKEGFITD